MRIMRYTYGSFPLGAGGLGFRIHDYSLQMAAAGHHVYMLAGGPSDGSLKRPTVERVAPRYHIMRVPELSRSFGVPINPSAGEFSTRGLVDKLKEHVSKAVKEFLPDVIHCSDLHRRCEDDAMALPDDVPLIHEVHTYQDVKSGRSALDRKWDAQVFVSSTLAREFAVATAGGLAQHVIRPGFSPSFHPAAALDDEMIALLQKIPADGQMVVHPTGRIKKRKGPDVGVASSLLLAKKYPHLHHVLTTAPDVGNHKEADSDYQTSFKASLERHPMADRIHIIERGPDQMPALFSAARRRRGVAIYPSRNEGFGLVPVQAQASGVPVAVSGVHGLRETILHGQSGFLVPPGDPTFLAYAVDQLISNEPLRNSFVERGIEHSKSFSDTRVIKKWLDLYEGVRDSRLAENGSSQRRAVPAPDVRHAGLML